MDSDRKFSISVELRHLKNVSRKQRGKKNSFHRYSNPRKKMDVPSSIMEYFNPENGIYLLQSLYPIIWAKLQENHQIVVVAFHDYTGMQKFLFPSLYSKIEKSDIPIIITFPLSGFPLHILPLTETFKKCSQEPERVAVVFGTSPNVTFLGEGSFPLRSIYVASIARNTDAFNLLRTNTCLSCQRVLLKLLRCSKCKVAFYCSEKCQCRHWFIHKHVCQDYVVFSPTSVKRQPNISEVSEDAGRALDESLSNQMQATSIIQQ
jgi:hypothetical protein